MNSAALDGQRILVIFLNASDSHETYVLAGKGRAGSWGLEVHPDDGGAPVTLPPVDVEKSSFGPEMLPRLIGRDDSWQAVRDVAHGVSRCVPTLVSPPPTAIHAPDLIANLVGGPNGELFLMQVR